MFRVGDLVTPDPSAFTDKLRQEPLDGVAALVGRVFVIKELDPDNDIIFSEKLPEGAHIWLAKYWCHANIEILKSIKRCLTN